MIPYLQIMCEKKIPQKFDAPLFQQLSALIYLSTICKDIAQYFFAKISLVKLKKG